MKPAQKGYKSRVKSGRARALGVTENIAQRRKEIARACWHISACTYSTYQSQYHYHSVSRIDDVDIEKIDSLDGTYTPKSEENLIEDESISNSNVPQDRNTVNLTAHREVKEKRRID